MKKKPDLLGQRFYKLLVIDRIPLYRGKFNWLCKCDCGNKLIVCRTYLTKGYKKSCGCWRKPRPENPFIERFWKNVKKTEDCWWWTGSTTSSFGYKYGQLSVNGVPLRCNRISWEIHFGKIPKGMFVCHKCDNPTCVKPDHLFLGTQKDNMKDCKEKRRNWISCGEDRKNSKLSKENVIEIRRTYDPKIFSFSKLSKIYGVCKKNISDIVKRKAWKHVN